MPTRHLLRVVLAWLLAGGMAPVIAQPLPQFMDNHALLLAGDFATLESRYPVDIAQDAGGPAAEALSYHYFLQLEVGLFPDNWPLEDKATRAWLESSPASVPAALARAYGLARRANRFDAAGDWAGVETALREQEPLLVATRTRAAKDIVWHTLYVGFGSKQGWPSARIRSAVEAGLDAHPSAQSFHLAAAAALARDWRGSAEPLEWLARQGAARLLPPHDAALYASVRIWTARFIEAVYLQPFEAGLIDWKMMNEGMTQLYRRDADIGTLNEHAALACRAGDKVATAALLARIGTAVVPDFWKRWGGVSHYENCRKWAEEGALKS